MAEKTWGKTVLGWFVVQGSEGTSPASPAGAATLDEADQLIAKYASAEPAEASPLPNLKGPLPPVVSGNIDFEQVFEAGGVDAAERDRVQKAKELLRSLPAETPNTVKRQIVEASLKAFGVPTDKIIEAAVESIQALEAFIRAGQGETQKTLGDATARIAALEQEIVDLRAIMQNAVSEQETRMHGANQKKLEMQEVLEFFGQEAVARVVTDSPKLYEPKG